MSKVGKALGNFFSGGFSGVTDAVGSLVEKGGQVADRFINTKEDRQRFRKEFHKLLQDHQEQMQQELTKRHQYDMNSDSWLSKNIRPLTLVFCLTIFTALSFTDGNIGGFEVDEAYKAIIKQMMLMVFSFYFGSRMIEKLTQTIKGKNENKN